MACAAVALLLHGAFLAGSSGIVPGGDAAERAAAMTVRAVADRGASTAPVAATEADVAPVPDAAPAVAPTMPSGTSPAIASIARAGPPPSRPRAAREPVGAASATAAAAGSSDARPSAAEDASSAASASTGSSGTSAAEATAAGEPGPSLPASAAAPELVTAALPPPAAAIAPAAAGGQGVEAPASAAVPGGAAPPPLLAEGEQPPPTYRTRLPPSATLIYQVRRGFLRGTGEIRWRPMDDGSYGLVLEARVAGLTLLVQRSDGRIDGAGLAPVRFVDQRARRAPQAANFRRDAGTVTFSGPGVEWPLLPGSQDRLSWMIQLAGIAAAEPELLAAGGRIAMAVFGARGEASVWTLRSLGFDDVETASGTVRAIKLVREARSAYDTAAEIWLDPARDYLPAHATLRNGSGASEYDLLLERVEAAP